jgi:hypothetical protein
MPKGVYPRTANQRRAASERLRRLWRNPELRAKWAAAASQRMRQLNADPANRRKAAAGSRAANRRPEKRALVSAIQRKRWQDEAERALYAERQRARMADPVKRLAAVKGARKGRFKLYGTAFECPRHLRKLYRKIRIALGRDAALREIRRIVARENGVR